MVDTTKLLDRIVHQQSEATGPVLLIAAVLAAVAIFALAGGRPSQLSELNDRLMGGGRFTPPSLPAAIVALLAVLAVSAVLFAMFAGALR